MRASKFNFDKGNKILTNVRQKREKYRPTNINILKIKHNIVYKEVVNLMESFHRFFVIKWQNRAKILNHDYGGFERFKWWEIENT